MSRVIKFAEVPAVSQGDIDSIYEKTKNGLVGAPNGGLYGPYALAEFKHAKDTLNFVAAGLTKNYIHEVNELVLPIVLYPDQNEFTVHVRKMSGQTPLIEIPEFAQMRGHIETVDVLNVKMVRFGSGSTISMNLLITDGGKETLALKLLEIANQVSKTLGLVALKSLYDACIYKNPRFNRPSDYLNKIDADMRAFGRANKDPTGFHDLISIYRTEMENHPHFPCNPNALIVPQRVAELVFRLGSRYNKFSSAGEQADKRMRQAESDVEYQGLKIIKASFPPNDDPSRATHTVGSYVPVYKQQGMPDAIPIVRVLDDLAGQFVPISLGDMIKSSGMFQRDGNNFKFLVPDNDAEKARHPLYKPGPPPAPGAAAGPLFVPVYDDLLGVPPAGGDAVPGATKTLEEWCNGQGNWPGFVGLLVRPHETYSMLDALMVEGGNGLGFTARSLDCLTESRDAANGSMSMSYSLFAAGVVLHPEKVTRIPACFYGGMEGGTNPRLITKDESANLAQRGWKLADPSSPAAYAVLIPKTDEIKVSLGGKLHLLTPRTNPAINRGLVDEKWADWYSWKLGQASLTYSSKDRIAAWCAPAPYQYITEAGAMIHIPGAGHHGPRQSELNSDIRKTGLGVCE